MMLLPFARQMTLTAQLQQCSEGQQRHAGGVQDDQWGGGAGVPQYDDDADDDYGDGEGGWMGAGGGDEAADDGGRAMQLVDEPQRVGKVEVTYARKSKQVQGNDILMFMCW